MANRRVICGSRDRFLLLRLQNHCGQWLQPWNQKTVASWQGSDYKPRQHVEKQRCYSVDKGQYSQGYGLLSGHVQLWELDHKEGWAPKNWFLQARVLEMTPESPLDCKEIKLANLKGDQPWVFTGRTNAEAPVFRSFDANRWLIEKVPSAGRDWEQGKRASENDIAGQHH